MAGRKKTAPETVEAEVVNEVAVYAQVRKFYSEQPKVDVTIRAIEPGNV